VSEHGRVQDPGDRYVIISSDCHAGADILGYKPYLERKWYDEFESWAASFHDPWEDMLGSTREDMLGNGQAAEDVNFGLASRDSSLNWDGRRRTEVLEADGIAAEVLFPNTAPPFFPAGVFSVSVPRTPAEYERRWAGLRAHNRWMAEFAADAPGRRAGLAQVFLNDIDDAVAEIRWAKEAGLRGVLIPSDNVVTVPLYYPRLDPIWQVCEELELPVHRHTSFPSDSASKENGAAPPMIGLLEVEFFTQRGLAHLMFSGVFDRFPGLKFVMTEGGCAWIVNYLNQLDALYEIAHQPGTVPNRFAHQAVRAMSWKPSEYFRTNCFLGASLMTKQECALRHNIGLGTIMWGSDLPHLEGTYPYTRQALQAVFSDVPPDEVQMMLGTNAAGVYGLDMKFLQGIANRIGPTVESVRTPLTVWPRTPEETIHPGLAPAAIPGYGDLADPAKV